ncbi:winged helix-turn-helix domain-containing protein [Dyella acidiphila]|uniref:Winged helix-turn-helix domain-containing protein n=1 Tax=Dyella acidiphila TaxID=2775866 RepID=A0ABR9G9N5_9GAMM|nr:FlgO family outer membrane protein [Dyella acidiphila]MBE1160765.1 winged helix-turn-helix domain-containing protein [Dyella acidiphila]
MSSGVEQSSQARLRIGDWTVSPVSGQMTRGEETVRLEARTLRLLLCLAEKAGHVVSIDDLLGEVWQGVIVTPDSVYQAVTSLRRLLGDDPRQPVYIATVPRRGYRMVAAVSSPDQPGRPTVTQAAANEEFAPPAAPVQRPASGRLYTRLLAIVALLVLACLGFYLLTRPSLPAPSTTASVAPNPRSIAVLPFLDLTDAMNEEPFADGMTEELIDKLSQSRGLQVIPPTSSFYFKGKQVTIAQVAKALHVAYVLDGSVRKSGNTLRVAARLVRAGDGFVVWSQTYDRSWDDKLMIQDDIAGEVAKALNGSIR